MSEQETLEQAARFIAARDYLCGPPLWEDTLIEQRWVELDPERHSHYLFLARGALDGLARIGKPVT